MVICYQFISVLAQTKPAVTLRFEMCYKKEKRTVIQELCNAFIILQELFCRDAGQVQCARYQGPVMSPYRASGSQDVLSNEIITSTKMKHLFQFYT